MAAPSWGSPTAKFLREGLRSRGPVNSEDECVRTVSVAGIGFNVS